MCKLFLIWSLCLLQSTTGMRRESLWNAVRDQDDQASVTIFPNYMFKDSYVSVLMLCSSKESVHISVEWYLQQLHCMDEMYDKQAKAQSQLFGWIDFPHSEGRINKSIPGESEKWRLVSTTKYQMSERQYSCGSQSQSLLLSLEDEYNFPYEIRRIYESTEEGVPERDTQVEIVDDRANKTQTDKLQYRVASVWEDGMYQFMVRISPVKKSDNFTVEMRVAMRSRSGYLSAIVWPILPLSGILSFLYLLAGTVWVFTWARAHQHSKKIHIVIGVVAVAGAMANTFRFVDLSTLNNNGFGYSGILWVSRLIDTFRSTITALVLMIVSTGYGITRPKLSRPLLNATLSISAAHYLAEMFLTVMTDEYLQLKYNYPGVTIAAVVTYGVILLIEGGWIMIFSILTFVHLCRRRHSQKLKVFCTYMAMCIITFVALLVVLGFANGFFVACRTDWKHEWLLQSFGGMEHLVLLAVLMWLWRPADEAQSYAFSPIGVEDYEEEDEDGEQVLYKKENIELEPFK